MIEEDKFLQRCRIELAISAELQRRLRHPIWFPRSVESESVGFSLGYADHGIEKRCGDEKEGAQNQYQQWKSGRIGNAANIPLVSPAPHSAVKQSASKRESHEDKNSGIDQQFRA